MKCKQKTIRFALPINVPVLHPLRFPMALRALNKRLKIFYPLYKPHRFIHENNRQESPEVFCWQKKNGFCQPWGVGAGWCSLKPGKNVSLMFIVEMQCCNIYASLMYRGGGIQCLTPLDVCFNVRRPGPRRQSGGRYVRFSRSLLPAFFPVKFFSVCCKTCWRYFSRAADVAHGRRGVIKSGDNSKSSLSWTSGWHVLCRVYLSLDQMLAI